MIDRDKNIDRNIVKMWFQVAKKHNAILSLYKTDNALKNTVGFENQGIMKIINNPTYSSKTLIRETISEFKRRFNKTRLDTTTKINYFHEKIK